MLKKLFQNNLGPLDCDPFLSILHFEPLYGMHSLKFYENETTID